MNETQPERGTLSSDFEDLLGPSVNLDPDVQRILAALDATPPDGRRTAAFELLRSELPPAKLRKLMAEFQPRNKGGRPKKPWTEEIEAFLMSLYDLDDGSRGMHDRVASRLFAHYPEFDASNHALRAKHRELLNRSGGSPSGVASTLRKLGLPTTPLNQMLVRLLQLT